MKKILISICLLIISALPLTSLAASTQANSNQSPKAFTSTTIQKSANNEAMTQMMSKMKKKKQYRMAYKMMKMGVKMKIIGEHLSKSSDSVQQANGKQMSTLGEQLFTLGKNMGGDKIMKYKKMHHMHMKKMMQQNTQPMNQ